MANTIVVDAMGGDHAPLEVVKGVAELINENNDINVLLVGDESQINNSFKSIQFNGDIPIIHTNQAVAMDDSPKTALNEKPRASILVAMETINEGKADALVSAGNTGATVLACAQKLKMIEGLERSALAAIYPTAKFNPDARQRALMLDVGATIKCNSKQLVHFAIMGHYYMQKIMNIEKPKVALLNNGEEASKGGPVLTQAYKYLKAIGNINFYGNIEGKDIPKGTVDVVITEGFVGNVVLKLLEGVADVLKDTGKYAFKQKFTWKIALALLSQGVRKIKHKTDYSEYGGAPILGFDKVVIKAHGRSNAKAIKNAIKVADRAVQQDIVSSISDSIHKFNEEHQIDFVEV